MPPQPVPPSARRPLHAAVPTTTDGARSVLRFLATRMTQIGRRAPDLAGLTVRDGDRVHGALGHAEWVETREAARVAIHALEGLLAATDGVDREHEEDLRAHAGRPSPDAAGGPASS